MSVKDFNLEPLLDSVDGDADVMSEVLSLFINSTQDNLASIRGAIEKNDGKAVKTTAHLLKGSLLELGAARLVAMAQQLENMGSAQQLAGAMAVWQDLEAGLRDLVNALLQTPYCRSA